MLDIRRADIVAGRELDVLRNVDDDGSGPAGARDVESFVQHARQVVDVLDQRVVLRARPRDADRIAFLKRVVADEMRRHLTCDADERNGIHQRVGKAGHGVGRARARRHQTDADLAGRPGIAFRRMKRTALLANEDVADLSPAETARRRSAARRRPDSRKSARRPDRRAPSTQSRRPSSCVPYAQLLPGRPARLSSKTPRDRRRRSLIGQR